MKSNGKIWQYYAWIYIVFLLACLTLVGCRKSSTGDGPPTPDLTAITIAPADFDMAVGDNLQLTATILGADGDPIDPGDLAWSSDDPGVATVDPNGLVSGVSIGASSIKASSASLGVESNVAGIRVHLPAPADLQASALSGARVSLTWEYTPHDSQDPSEGIGVARKGGHLDHWVVIGSVPAGASSYVDDYRVAPQISYSYQVFAYNAEDFSFPSAMTQAATPEVLAGPSDPDGLAADLVDPWRVEISWNDQADNEDGYRIERSPDGINFSEIDRVGPNVSSYADSRVEENTTYHYQVVAFNSFGDSASSGAVMASTPDSVATVLGGNVSVDSQLAAGDYLISGGNGLIVDAGVTLTIDPGAVLRFEDGEFLEIQGSLLAEGSQDQPIIFTSSHPTSAAKDSWGGLDLLLSGEDVLKLRHAEISFAEIGLDFQEIFEEGEKQMLGDVSLQDNQLGIKQFAGVSLPEEPLPGQIVANRMHLQGNDTGAQDLQGYLCFSSFRSNGIGATGLGARTCIDYNYNQYSGSTQAAVEDVYNTDMIGCLFDGNEVGFRNTEEILVNDISASTFVDNQVGLELVLGLAVVGQNNLYGSLHLMDAADLDVSSNFWGSTDPADIEAAIQDQMDDAELGLATYNPFLEAAVDALPSLPGFTPQLAPEGTGNSATLDN